MKSNKQFSNLYDKKNISRIKYIAKFNAREIHFAEDDKLEFNLNYNSTIVILDIHGYKLFRI